MAHAQQATKEFSVPTEETDKQRFVRMEAIQKKIQEGGERLYRQRTEFCSTEDIGWYAEVRVEQALRVLKKSRPFHLLNQIQRTTRSGKQDSNGVDIYITFWERSMRIPLQVKSGKKEKKNFQIKFRNKGDPIRVILCPLSMSYENLLKEVERVLRNIYKTHDMEIG